MSSARYYTAVSKGSKDGKKNPTTSRGEEPNTLITEKSEARLLHVKKKLTLGAPESLELAGKYCELWTLCVELNRFDEAKHYLEKAVSIQERMAVNPMKLAQMYHDLVNVCNRLNLLDEAKWNLEKAKPFFVQAKQTEMDNLMAKDAQVSDLEDSDESSFSQEGVEVSDLEISDQSTFNQQVRGPVPRLIEVENVAIDFDAVKKRRAVFFAMFSHPDTMLWRAMVLEFSNNIHNYPNWSASVADVIRQRLEKEGISEFFVRNKKQIEAGTSYNSNKWREATEHEFVTQTKQLFLEDRRDGGMPADNVLTDVFNITGLPGYGKARVAQFLGAEDALHLALSCKNLYQTCLLSYVQPGTIFKTPVKWRGESDTGDTPRKYQRIPLLFSSRLRSVGMSVHWKDQGWGNEKGRIYIVAADASQPKHDVWPRNDIRKYTPIEQKELFDGGRLVYESPTAKHDYDTLRFSFRPKPNEAYYLWYKVGGGGGHELKLFDVRLMTALRPATLLHEACIFGVVKLVESLLRQGADPNVQDSDGWTPLHEASLSGNSYIVQLLLDHCAEQNAAAKDGRTALHEAGRNGDEAITAILLKANSDPNASDCNGRTPLHEACEHGHDSVVKLLLENDADSNTRDKDKSAPLHQACTNGREDIVALLLKHGADPDAATKDGWTPLHEASKNGYEAITTLLLKHEAEVNSLTIDSWTPLHQAAKSGSRAVAEVLLRNHAYTNSMDKNGLTPLHVALSFRSNFNTVDAVLLAAIEKSVNTDGHLSLVAALPASTSSNLGTWKTPFTFLFTGAVRKMLLKINFKPDGLPRTKNVLDKVLRNLKDEERETCALHLGDRHAMSDNLVAEAFAVGIEGERIVHAMFACAQSRSWLHDFLVEQCQVSDKLISAVLDVLHGGVHVDCGEFTDALLRHASCIKFAGLSAEPLDICNDYHEVPSLFIEDGGMKAYLHSSCYIEKTNPEGPARHAECKKGYARIKRTVHLKMINGVVCEQDFREGVYRIEGISITCALVPHKDGVKYYVHNDCLDVVKETTCGQNLFRTSGKDPHLVQDAVNQLVDLKCDEMIAWRLLSCAKVLPKSASVCEKLIQSFRIISSFRVHLTKVITAAAKDNVLEQRLLGSKSELGNHGKFKLSWHLYNSAKGKCLDNGEVSLTPFTREFLAFDGQTSLLCLIGKLIEKARKSDLMKGKAKQQQFDFCPVALLGAVNGCKINRSDVPNYAKTRYCYQDRDHTKCLFTPCSNLMIFATLCDLGIPEQVQHLENETSTLNNWIALRAAFEFDAEEDTFSYGTPEYKRANYLVSKSPALFIQDINFRFAQVFTASPNNVSVSSLRTLCDKIAARTDASSAWLVRELVSRYIAYGASVSGREEDTGYGKMEMTMKRIHYQLPSSVKVLHFDEKVDQDGVMYRIQQNGRVCLREHFPGKEGFHVVVSDGRVDVIADVVDLGW